MIRSTNRISRSLGWLAFCCCVPNVRYHSTVSSRICITCGAVSSATRDALASRSLPDDADYVPQVLDPMSVATLRALINRIIPQSPPHYIDLAARIDQQLAQGVGDGWRFAALPADTVAYRLGLHTLDSDATRRFGAPFAHLPVPRQDELLSIAAAGDGGGDGNGNSVVNDGGEDPSSPASGSDQFNAAQLRAWFEEARADAVKLYVAHPTTLARIGYSGIANGGDGLPKSGFVRVGFGEREDWEPLPTAAEDS